MLSVAAKFHAAFNEQLAKPPQVVMLMTVSLVSI
jgi:hypothetical protein